MARHLSVAAFILALGVTGTLGQFGQTFTGDGTYYGAPARRSSRGLAIDMSRLPERRSSPGLAPRR